MTKTYNAIIADNRLEWTSIFFENFSKKVDAYLFVMKDICHAGAFDAYDEMNKLYPKYKEPYDVVFEISRRLYKEYFKG